MNPNASESKKTYLTVAVIFVALLIGGFLYWQKNKTQTPERDVLGAQIFESAQNPINNEIPDTNPFSADTNPFDDEANPFAASYQNPFK